jgi:hypothetical protein
MDLFIIFLIILFIFILVPQGATRNIVLFILLAWLATELRMIRTGSCKIKAANTDSNNTSTAAPATPTPSSSTTESFYLDELAKMEPNILKRDPLADFLQNPPPDMLSDDALIADQDTYGSAVPTTTIVPY